MSTEVTIWHYPRCSKSRKTLAILRDEQAELTIRRYLDDPPGKKRLAEAVDQLGISPRQLVRTNEDLYGEVVDDADSLDDGEWIELLAEHPRLLQRPVVFTDAGAVVARPPERVLELLS